MSKARSMSKNDWDSTAMTQAAADLLTDPHRWCIVSSAFKPEVTPVQNDQHLEWMRENSHLHGHQEILIALNGCGVHGFRGKVYPYSPGTMFLFDCLEEHDYRCPVGAPDADMLWVVIVHNLVIFSQIKIRKGCFNYYRWKRLAGNRSLGFAEWRNAFAYVKQPELPEEHRRLRAYHVMSGLLSAIMENGFIDESNRDRESFQRSIVEAVQSHILNTHQVGITLDDLAHLSGYSKYHLSRLFKQYTGKTIHDHIDYIRMAHAQDLLAKGLTKKEVSSQLGFSCPAAFSRWLRQYGG